MKSVAVIMAGGVGERFWPMSRHTYPKQLLKIGDKRTMLDAAVERIQPLVQAEDVYVITSISLRDSIVAALHSIPAENIIAEPEGKNTAACLALACSYFESRFEEDVLMYVLTADHYIGNVAAFQRDCLAAGEFAQEHEALVTFGIRPARPEVGYGYIEVGEPASSSAPIFQVKSFREKPDLQTAQRFLHHGGGFLWNSGMFVWRNSVLRQAFARHLPATHSRLPALTAAFSNADYVPALAAAFQPLEKISIDVGVMERAANVHVLRASFDWDDIGTWTSLQRLLERDSAGNVVFGQAKALKCEDTIVYSVEPQQGSDRPRLVVGYNLNDMIVVNTPDAVLVLPAADVQRVKDIVHYLREQGLGEYL